MSPHSPRYVTFADRLYLNADYTPYMGHVDQLQPGDKVVLAIRISTREQSGSLAATQRKLESYAQHLRHEAEARGAIVIDHTNQAPDLPMGKVTSGQDASWIVPLIKFAKQHGAQYLLAATPNRFIRSPLYRSDKHTLRQAKAPLTMLQELHRHADGIGLLTLTAPNAGEEEQQNLLRRWGRPGRPKKVPSSSKGARKQRHEQGLDLIGQLAKQGIPRAAIAKRLQANLGVSVRTAYQWLDKAK